MSDGDDKRQKGAQLAEKLFGGIPPNSALPADFQRLTLEHLFGDVWQDDRLSFQQRSMITCTALVALNREAEQRVHFTGAKNLGIPRADIEAMITHLAHYAGWPSAVSAFRVLREVWPIDDDTT